MICPKCEGGGILEIDGIEGECACCLGIGYIDGATINLMPSKNYYDENARCGIIVEGFSMCELMQCPPSALQILYLHLYENAALYGNSANQAFVNIRQVATDKGVELKEYIEVTK